jgi:hypothetical protein
MSDSPIGPSNEKPKLSALQYIWIGWPVVLVFVGGLIGGACGGAAIAINHTIFQRASNNFMRYFATGLISVGALVTWFVLVAVLTSALKH